MADKKKSDMVAQILTGQDLTDEQVRMAEEHAKKFMEGYEDTIKKASAKNPALVENLRPQIENAVTHALLGVENAESIPANILYNLGTQIASEISQKLEENKKLIERIKQSVNKAAEQHATPSKRR